MAKRRRKKGWTKGKKLLLGVVIILMAGFIALLYKNFMVNNYIRYGKPGIYVPRQYSVHGLDVSHYQGNVSWKGVNEMRYGDIKMRFVFIKATQGTRLVDDRFKKNWKDAGKHNIARGAYHYMEPSKNIQEQINLFTKVVNLKSGDLPPVLDIEQTDRLSAKQIQHAVLLWLQAIEKIYGVCPIIYTNVDFYKNYLGEAFDKYPLWIAHYSKRVEPGIKRNWDFWQLSDRSTINGIESFTDFNVFNGDTLAFEQIRIP